MESYQHWLYKQPFLLQAEPQPFLLKVYLSLFEPQNTTTPLVDLLTSRLKELNIALKQPPQTLVDYHLVLKENHLQLNHRRIWQHLFEKAQSLEVTDFPCYAPDLSLDTLCSLGHRILLIHFLKNENKYKNYPEEGRPTTNALFCDSKILSTYKEKTRQNTILEEILNHVKGWGLNDTCEELKTSSSEPPLSLEHIYAKAQNNQKYLRTQSVLDRCWGGSLPFELKVLLQDKPTFDGITKIKKIAADDNHYRSLLLDLQSTLPFNVLYDLPQLPEVIWPDDMSQLLPHYNSLKKQSNTLSKLFSSLACNLLIRFNELNDFKDLYFLNTTLATQIAQSKHEVIHLNGIKWMAPAIAEILVRGNKKSIHLPQLRLNKQLLHIFSEFKGERLELSHANTLMYPTPEELQLYCRVKFSLLEVFIDTIDETFAKIIVHYVGESLELRHVHTITPEAIKILQAHPATSYSMQPFFKWDSNIVDQLPPSKLTPPYHQRLLNYTATSEHITLGHNGCSWENHYQFPYIDTLNVAVIEQLKSLLCRGDEQISFPHLLHIDCHALEQLQEKTFRSLTLCIPYLSSELAFQLSKLSVDTLTICNLLETTQEAVYLLIESQASSISFQDALLPLDVLAVLHFFDGHVQVEDQTLGDIYTPSTPIDTAGRPSIDHALLSMIDYPNNTITEIDIHQAVQLCQSHKDIYLNNLRRLEFWIIRILCQANCRILSLNGITRLQVKSLSYLSQCKCGTLQLEGLTHLTPKDARILALFKGISLKLNGLLNISPALAESLTHFRGDYLELKGLTSIDFEIAKILAQFKGYISLGQIEPVSAQLRLFLRKKRSLTFFSFQETDIC